MEMCSIKLLCMCDHVFTFICKKLLVKYTIKNRKKLVFHRKQEKEAFKGVFVDLLIFVITVSAQQVQ